MLIKVPEKSIKLLVENYDFYPTKLLIESVEDSPQLIFEGPQEFFQLDKKRINEIKEGITNQVIHLEGVLQRGETLNQNGRIYPSPILKREVMNYQKKIAEGLAYGECDHPESTVIELKNVSHLIREAYMQGNIVYGKLEVLNTPSGMIIQRILEHGGRIGVSSRGLGSTRKINGHEVVQDDFQLICWDFVSEPSVPGAYMNKVMEGKLIHPGQLMVEVRKQDGTVKLQKVFDKSDRVHRALTEILSW